MAKRTVKWTETAAKQRRSILKYWTIRNHSIVYAEKIIRLSEKYTLQISENPLRFKQTDYPETRIAIMGHFSIFFKHTDLEIIIVAFWDNRQDPQKLLEIINK